MTKVQLAVLRDEKEELLRWLQDEEIIHITPLKPNGEIATTGDTEYQLAQVQFALEFISRLRAELNQPKEKSWRTMFASKPAASLDVLEQTLTELNLDTLLRTIQQKSDSLSEIRSQIMALTEEIELFKPWHALVITGDQLQGTHNTRHALVCINLQEEEFFLNRLQNIPSAVWQEVERIVEKKSGTLYFEVVIDHADNELLEAALLHTTAELVELPLPNDTTVSAHLTTLTEQQNELLEKREAILSEAKGFLEKEEKLQFAYDALLHKQQREELEMTTVESPFTYILAGWIPTHSLDSFMKQLSKKIPSAAVEKITPEEDEIPPVVFQNSRFIAPFEAVTDIYGKPRYNEIDPSPVLSLFFLIAFGLAFTDAGYGLMMMASTAAALRFFKLKRGMKQMVQLLFLAGVSTTVIGALTGGWFGITLEELSPSAVKDLLLSIKIIDPIADPITLLMVAFALGVLQLLFAWGVKGYDSWRKGDHIAAILDSGAWITMVIAILAWASTMRGILPAAWQDITRALVIINAGLLVFTQGRQHRNVFLRLGVGTLSLYNLVGFLSDVLSYSRLLALGLATAIIGLVVNLIGGMVVDMIPVVGVAIAAVILLFGHLFNIGINALGAFIHSGRLQFVEFFPKFMEGGGAPYRPFGRISKYVDNPQDFL